MFSVQCSGFVFSEMTRVLLFRSRQHTRTLALPMLRRLTRHVLENEFGVTDYELGLHFVPPEEMARVNERFLQHTGSTDVITFDHSPPHGAPASGTPRLHGEIFICVADAVKQAREFRTTWQLEVVRYIIHGLLHLRGHDDLKPAARKVMKREEHRLLKQAAACFPIHSLTRRPKSQIPNPKS